MITELETRIDEIAAICREFDVVRLEVFGSAASGTWNPESSDFDFMVTYPPGYDFGPWLIRFQQLEDRLAAALQRDVDVVIVGRRHPDSRHLRLLEGPKATIYER